MPTVSQSAVVGGAGKPAGAMVRLLSTFRYFAQWPEAELRAAAESAALCEYQLGEAVLASGGDDPHDFFLINGELLLCQRIQGETVERRLRAGDVDAGYPIAHLRPSRYHVLAGARSHVLRVDGGLLRGLRSGDRPGTSRFCVTGRSTAGPWLDHPAYHELRDDLNNGRLKVPALPAVAQRVQNQLADPNVDLAQVAALVQSEPTLAAKLIKVANSVALGAKTRADTVTDALVRLGIETSKRLVFAFASEQLFRDTPPSVRRRAQTLWAHSVEIGALAMVLAGMTPGMSPERALLVGLLHEIGSIPILGYIAKYPDLAATDVVADDLLKGMSLEVGEYVLRGWKFPEDFLQAVRASEDWFRDGGNRPDFCDLLIVAHLHALIKHKKFDQLPRIDETPAFSKLAFGELSPKLSLLVLEEAQAKIKEVKSALV